MIIDNAQQNNKCRSCGERNKTVNPITSECNKLAQKEYQIRREWVGKVIHWELCKRLRLPYDFLVQVRNFLLPLS